MNDDDPLAILRQIVCEGWAGRLEAAEPVVLMLVAHGFNTPHSIVAKGVRRATAYRSLKTLVRKRLLRIVTRRGLNTPRVYALKPPRNGRK